MTGFQTQQLASWISNSRPENIAPAVLDKLKMHLLDSLGSLIHARDQHTILKLIRQLKDYGGSGPCRVPYLPGLPVDKAAQLYTALIRYPDFMDNYLGKESTCHPSDNIGALLAASQLGSGSGVEFLHSMALAYAIECRLTEEIPVMTKGFDHTLLLAWSVTAALSKMLDLTEEQTAFALGMAGCSQLPLVTCRASYTYEWKGLASSLVAMSCVNIVMLAKCGITGPLSLFEGPRGFNEIFQMPLNYDWKNEDFTSIAKCALKHHNAEVHTQSAIEAILELRAKHEFDINDINDIDVTTFLTAWHITGGGEYGDRKHVHSKEQGDHSMAYVLAAALLDGQVGPEQYSAERLNRPDIRDLMSRIEIHTSSPIHKPLILAGVLDPYTRAYPDEMPAKVSIVLRDKKTLTCEKRYFKGHPTHPFSWEDTILKFRRLTGRVLPALDQEAIIDSAMNLEERDLHDLVGWLIK